MFFQFQAYHVWCANQRSGSRRLVEAFVCTSKVAHNRWRVLPLTEAVPRQHALPARTVGFTRYAWGVLGWNLFVILWGAYVRASGSGAGCGSHWPLCNGEVVPHSPHIQTIIEFTHRVTSGIAVFLTVAMAVWAFRAFPRGGRVRRAAIVSVALLFIEALLGAGLVLFRYVAQDASVGRAIYLSLHLVNTQFLLAALLLTAWYSRAGATVATGRRMGVVAATLPVALAISVTGTIAALGDTLFPSLSLAEGMRQDTSVTASFLVRLRILHPAIAILGAAFILFAAVAVLRSGAKPLTQRIAVAAIVVTLAQLAVGAMNLALLAPVGCRFFISSRRTWCGPL